MIYADYNYYQLEYKGDAISEADYDHAVLVASQMIDNFTFNRAKDYSDLTGVKMATCAVADVIYEFESAERASGGRDVQSENNDGYSVTYAVDTSRSSTLRLLAKAREAAGLWLMTTGLMYRGIALAD